jgi:tetratricopeptide (TPR) repeat protein
MDTDNPVVMLCIEGMQAEAEGRVNDAQAMFLRAWSLRQDSYDACIAAHYVARHQPTANDTLQWNQEALHQAANVDAVRIENFYPSLYLNLAYSHEVLEDYAAAIRYYDLALEKASVLPQDGYGDLVRRGIAEGRGRIGPAES